MKISMVIYGTRGDVQPTLALALGLKKIGHEVIICAPSENEELVKLYDCPFMALGTSIKDKLSENSSKSDSPKTRPSPKFMKQEINNQLNQLPEVIKDSDLVLAVGYILGVPTVCNKLNIPYRFLAFYPAILGPSKKAPKSGRLLWAFGKLAMNMVLKGFINKKRKELGLKPISDVWSYWMGELAIVASFPALGEVPADIDFKFTQTGYMFLPHKNLLGIEIEKFLISGKPPVFIGFGSNPIHDTQKFSRLISEVAKTTGQRFIISKGWAGLDKIQDQKDCLFVEEVPYDLLFHRLAAVIHHGGTGTVAAAALAGVPQAIFPFMADQFQNRDQLVKLGLIPYACDFKKLSAKALSSAVSECVSNEKYKKKAEEISKKIRDINGIELTIKVIEKELNQLE